MELLQAECSHPHLDEVPGLHGYYHCPACNDTFNLALINLTRHTPRDLAAMAQWMTRFLSTLNLPTATSTPALGETTNGDDTPDTGSGRLH